MHASTLLHSDPFLLRDRCDPERSGAGSLATTPGTLAHRPTAHRPSLLASGISKLHALNETKKSKFIQTTLPRLIGKKFNLRIKR